MEVRGMGGKEMGSGARVFRGLWKCCEGEKREN